VADVAKILLLAKALQLVPERLAALSGAFLTFLGLNG
jgi:hypothetical protein